MRDLEEIERDLQGFRRDGDFGFRGRVFLVAVKGTLRVTVVERTKRTL